MLRLLRWPRCGAAALGLSSLAALSAPHAAAAPSSPETTRKSTTCVEDEPIPTPPGYAGWERSSVVAWEAIEDQGGIVPDIEEDRNQAPPAWWRYPSPIRSAELLAREAKDAKGLYSAVSAPELKAGDLVIRTTGAGACGKMAIVAGLSHDAWVTVEAEGDGEITRSANPLFFAGKALRPEVAAYRISVKKDSTLGHVRELDRDLRHLERTIAERPPLIARKGQGVVDEKVHDLVDEAWSLVADPAFDDDRRALTGRALALAAALEWPSAMESASAVLDDELRRRPDRSDAAVARVSLMLLSGQPEKAAPLAESTAKGADVRPRAFYVLARALFATGRAAEGKEALRRYLDAEPSDPRALRLAASGGREPALATAAAPVDDGSGQDLRFSATPESATLHSALYGMDVSWPLTWRIAEHSAAPATGFVLEFATGRVLRDDGEAERGTVMLVAQRATPTGSSDGGESVKSLAKKGARNIFPDAKIKTLPPLVPGSRREQFRERSGGGLRQGEVTTLERAGTVCFLVLNASPATYGKLKDQYAAFVKSVTFH